MSQLTPTVGQAALLQTDTATLGTAIGNRTVLELPLNARYFFDLVALTPGGSSVMDGRSIQIALSGIPD